MANWTEEECRVLVELYNKGQVLNSKEITNFVYDYKNLNATCRIIVKDVYSSEKVKEDERIKKFKEDESKKTEEFNAQYPNTPYTEVKDNIQAIEKAKELVISKINDSMQIKDNFKIIDVSYNKMLIEVSDLNFTEVEQLQLKI